MKRNFRSLQEELTTALQAALDQPNDISRYLGCVQAAEMAISNMKEMVFDDPFLSVEEEIHHFKHEAPEVYSQLFYYLKLVEIEANRAYAGPERWLTFLGQVMVRLDEYFQTHDTICRYYQQGFVYQDAHLFLRRNVGQWSGDEIGAFIPTDFTIGSYWFSWIKANLRLREWVADQMARPESVNLSRKDVKVDWTGSRIDFIVIICGLYLDGCFKKETLQDVMEKLGRVFGVNTRQFHVALSEKAISKDPVEFLKRLLELMLRKFDSLLN